MAHILLQPLYLLLCPAAQTLDPPLNLRLILKAVDPPLLINLLLPKHTRTMITLFISVQPAAVPTWPGEPGRRTTKGLPSPSYRHPGNRPLARSRTPAWLQPHHQHGIVAPWQVCDKHDDGRNLQLFRGVCGHKQALSDVKAF